MERVEIGKEGLLVDSYLLCLLKALFERTYSTIKATRVK